MRAILLSLKTCEPDNLVSEDMAIGWHLQPFNHPEISLIFQASHKIHAFCRQLAKKPIIHQPPVKNNNRSRGKTKLLENCHLVNLPLADMHILGKIPLMIQKQMKFYRPLVRRNLAQSKRLAQSSIVVASKLSSLFLNRDLVFPENSPWQRLNKP